MTYLVFDTETTGLSRKYSNLNEPCSVTENGDEIIQIGGFVVDEQLNPIRAFCHYCDVLLPDSKSEARRVHQIGMETIRAEIPGTFFEEVACRFVPELFYKDVTFIGYNIDFDMQMVAQCLRNLCFPFENTTPVMGRLYKSGRHTLDVMKYLPGKSKLVSFSKELNADREAFFMKYAGVLPLECNIPGLLGATWEHNHNSLFDALETLLLLKQRVWGKKIIV